MLQVNATDGWFQDVNIPVTTKLTVVAKLNDDVAELAELINERFSKYYKNKLASKLTIRSIQKQGYNVDFDQIIGHVLKPEVTHTRSQHSFTSYPHSLYFSSFFFIYLSLSLSACVFVSCLSLMLVYRRKSVQP